jgi:hypothetical protein
VQDQPESESADRFVEYPVGTEIGISKGKAARLVVLEREVCKKQEELGELREEYLEAERTILGDIAEARAVLASHVVEIAAEHGVNLGSDNPEEWYYSPEEKVFKRGK